jgi:PEP-CTERM motif
MHTTAQTFARTLAIAAVAAMAVPAMAAPKPVAVPACSFGDLSSVTVTACSGFVQGNLLQGDTGNTVSTAVSAELGRLGMAQPGSALYIEKIGDNNGRFSVDFGTLLRGDTVIGIHLGGGSTRFASNIPGGATAFYRFNAGSTGLDTFALGSLMSASSGVAVFQTSPVPEPQTYALMLAGLAAVGFVASRRA